MAKTNDKAALVKYLTCQDCKTFLVRTPTGFCCQQGHGRIKPVRDRSETRLARVLLLPLATQAAVRVNDWTIEGKAGRFEKVKTRRDSTITARVGTRKVWMRAAM